ncbi:hypothetical protein CYMTET_18965 [Cymbomonas tetramitiformis]|uniref:Uncharacterized protein n=1 Tax=Cymbomonas tetramitiformis TaxID=36881 RepID=A0AAE0G728_9CHLO|nr:hypothetical protein CYMTET_18965 [Cymbomonas tetramitiformis]
MPRFKAPKSMVKHGNRWASSAVRAAASSATEPHASEEKQQAIEQLKKRVAGLKRTVAQLRKTCDAQAVDLEQSEFERRRQQKKIARQVREIAPDVPKTKKKNFKAEAPTTQKAELQRLERKGEHFERILKGFESAATVSESINSYSTQDTESQGQLPLHAEMLLGYLRYQDFGEQVATELLTCSTKQKLLDYIRSQPDLVTELFEEVLLKVDNTWSVERCHALKVLLGLSDDKYDRLRKLLSSTYDEDTGKWHPTVLHEIGDATFTMPKLKPLAAVKATREEIATSIDPSENGDGMVAEVDLLSLLREVVSKARYSKTGFLHEHREKATDDLEIFLSGDAHGKARGKKVTGVTLRVKAANGQYNNSPFHCYTFCYYEGSDNYANLAQYTKASQQYLSQLLADGITVDNTHYKVTIKCGGDLPYICSCLAHYGCSGNYPCPFCIVHYDDLMEADLDWDDLARTFRKMQVWTHTAKPPFYCEVCEKTFSARDIAQEKAPATKYASEKWVRSHYGMQYKQPIVFAPSADLDKMVEDHFVACVLHWLLRQVDSGFKVSIHAHADTDEKALALTAQLKELGISMSKTLKKWEAHKMSKDGAGKATFIGDHSVIVLAEYDVFLDMHTPEDRAELYEELWTEMVNTYEAIHDRLEDTKENRKLKAKSIKEAATKLDRAWENVVPDVKLPYMHIALVHLPRAILRHGTNLDQFSGQGIEHLGKLRQIYHQCASNRKGRVMRDKKTNGTKVQRRGEQGQVMLHEHERAAVMHTYPSLSRAQKNIKRKAESMAR